MEEESKYPWRPLLEKWPEEWRERWGHRANELEEAGMSMYEAEKLAWNETIVLKAEATEAAKRAASPMPPTVPIEPARSTRSLFGGAA